MSRECCVRIDAGPQHLHTNVCRGWAEREVGRRRGRSRMAQRKEEERDRHPTTEEEGHEAYKKLWERRRIESEQFTLPSLSNR